MLAAVEPVTSDDIVVLVLLVVKILAPGVTLVKVVAPVFVTDPAADKANEATAKVAVPCSTPAAPLIVTAVDAPSLAVPATLTVPKAISKAVTDALVPDNTKVPAPVFCIEPERFAANSAESVPATAISTAALSSKFMVKAAIAVRVIL